MRFELVRSYNHLDNYIDITLANITLSKIA